MQHTANLCITGGAEMYAETAFSATTYRPAGLLDWQLPLALKRYLCLVLLHHPAAADEEIA